MASELQTTLKSILVDKETNLLPENLKKGITCLGVEGTLDTSAPTNMNIFVQEEEPATKYGLWVKSAPRELTPSFVEASGPTFSTSVETISDVVPYYGLWSIYYKGYVYYLASTAYRRDDATSELHRYNPANGEDILWADLGFVPYRRFLEGSWLYYSNNTSIGKIDLDAIDSVEPITLYTDKQFWGYKSDDDGIAMAIHGEFAYFFGGQNVGVARSNSRKLHLDTGTITTLSTSVTTAYGPTLVIGDDIYIFRGYGTNQTSYKYNTKTNTFSTMPSCPIMCASYAYTPDNNLVYLCSWEDQTIQYVYDIRNGTYTKLSPLPEKASTTNFQNSYFTGTEIHYMRTGEHVVYVMASMEVMANHLVVYEYDRKYKTKLINNGPNTYLDDAIVVNDIGAIETDTYVYIGDGEDWI